jgi:hypothetical protein
LPSDQDVARAETVRRTWNELAVAWDGPKLPDRLDGVDLAVAELLAYERATGIHAPAGVLADLFREDLLVASGAVGAAPEAALTFWLEAPSESGEEDEESRLSAYFAARAAGEAAWGTRGSHPLVVTNAWLARLGADRTQFEKQVPEATERGRRREELERVCGDVRARLRRLGAPGGAP